MPSEILDEKHYQRRSTVFEKEDTFSKIGNFTQTLNLVISGLGKQKKSGICQRRRD